LKKTAPGTGGKSYLADVSTVKIEYYVSYNSGGISDTYNFIMFNINADSTPRISGMTTLKPASQNARWQTITTSTGYYEFRNIPPEYSNRLIVCAEKNGYKNSAINNVGVFTAVSTVTINIKMQELYNGIKPDAPQYIAISVIGDSLCISWKAAQNADLYYVYYDNNVSNEPFTNLKITTGRLANSAVISEYDKSKKYYFKIKAFSNTGGFSDYSIIVEK